MHKPQLQADEGDDRTAADLLVEQVGSFVLLASLFEGLRDC
jgi:hypothetical protein